MFRYILTAFLLVVLLPAYAMSDVPQWVKALPGTSLVSIERTLDGGYIAAGSKNYKNGSSKALLVRFDSSGNIQWARTYQLSNNDSASMVWKADDGGFVFIGSTSTNGGDAFLIKVDASGKILWQKVYGTPSHEDGTAIFRTSDGGFFVLGNSSSGTWCMKLDSKREISWVKIYGGTFAPRAAAGTREGGLMFVGGPDPTFVKIDSSGNITWRKETWGGMQATAVTTTFDGGYVVGGVLRVPMIGATGRVFKLDSQGNVSWSKGINYGGDFAGVSAVRQENDGHILVMGYGYYAGRNIFSARLSAQGEMLWNQTFGRGETHEGEILAIHDTFDDGTAFVGERNKDSRWDSLVGRTSAAGDVCTTLQESTHVRIYNLDMKVHFAHVRVTEGAFAVRTANFTQTPVDIRTIDLCQ